MESKKLIYRRKFWAYLLKFNYTIGKFLYFHYAKTMAEKDIKDISEQQKFDMRGISDRLKNVLLHDQDIIDKRWDECQKCEFLIKPTNNCTKCGCFMKVKTRVATASCPVGKWKAEYNFMEGRKATSNKVEVK